MNVCTPQFCQRSLPELVLSLFAGKLQKAWILGFLTIFFLAPTSAEAESLQVSIPTTVSETLPQITKRIGRALDATGIEISVISHLPNKRSLSMLSKGKIALEFFRTPAAMPNYSDLIRLQPPIQSIKLKMITSRKIPENCKAGEAEYRKLSIVGALGVRLHQVYFFPKFSRHTAVRDLPTTAKFVALQRADVTFLPDGVLTKIPKELMAKLIVCEDNFKIFDFHAHLHKDFSWAKDKIENALQAEFLY